MQNRMNVVQKAFEQTYNRAIHPDKPILSAFQAFIGWNYTKYERKGASVRTYRDQNIYNWLEQLLSLSRITKNIAKLGTEFIWNLLAESLVAASDTLIEKAEVAASDTRIRANTAANAFALRGLGTILWGLSFLPWIIAKAGQSITSPFAALKESYNFFAKQADTSRYPALWKGLGLLAAFLRGLFTVSAYAAIAIFAAPAIAAVLTSIGIGGSVIAGFTIAANWVASLPVISTVGAIFAAGVTTVGSALGLSLTSGFAASAAAVASLVIAATPVLAGLKAGFRKILPWKRKYIVELAPEVAPAVAPAVALEQNRYTVNDIRDLLMGPSVRPVRPVRENSKVDDQSNTALLPKTDESPTAISPGGPRVDLTHGGEVDKDSYILDDIFKDMAQKNYTY